MSDTIQVIKERRSVRKYQDRRVPQEVIDRIVEAGTYAPTGGGTQGVQIVAVQTPEYRDRVAALNAAVMGKDMDPYYGAPTIVLVFETPEGFTQGFDGPAVTTNIVNAAYAAGLGSCWIHRCRQMFEMEEGKELLKEWGLPEDLVGVASMALGYADCEQPVASPRKDNYVYWVE